MPLRFQKQPIAAESHEACGVGDINRDGHPDIVCGGFWYEGPSFIRRHPIVHATRHEDWYDDFSAILLDVDGDGWLDIVTGGWWGRTLRWRRNPGTSGGPWTEHVIAEIGNIETTRAWDLDGDGELEIVPNTPNHPLRAFRLVRGPDGRGTGVFREFVLGPPVGHGLGCGDLDGDGRPELVTARGWLHAPPDPWSGPWLPHPGPDLGTASVPILVADVNGDGRSDLIVGQAHGYGLDWYEQSRDASGEIRWIRHPIDPYNAQYHDLAWADLDGDGQPELITGKRYRAHLEKDDGALDDLGLYYFKWTGEGFAKQVIDFGPFGRGKGCGIQFALADLRGTGRLDLVAPGKDGLAVYHNLGTAPAAP